MARTKKTHRMGFGPAMPAVPITAFTEKSLSPEEFEAAWWICGPSVERNMTGKPGRRLELWQVIAAAYLEGLQHGADLAAERDKEGQS